MSCWGVDLHWTEPVGLSDAAGSCETGQKRRMESGLCFVKKSWHRHCAKDSGQDLVFALPPEPEKMAAAAVEMVGLVAGSKP